jgi:hypothetical protein
MFHFRIIRPRISLASSMLRNSQVSDISPPNTSRVAFARHYVLRSGDERGEKSVKFFHIHRLAALATDLRKSLRRSNSASVSGSGWLRVLIISTRYSSGGLDSHARTIPDFRDAHAPVRQSPHRDVVETSSHIQSSESIVRFCTKMLSRFRRGSLATIS